VSTESIFLPGDERRRRFTPTEHARGPWDPQALHGGAPAALMTAELERLEPGAELPFARLSFEFLRPIPLAPLELSTRITRPGRRVQALEAELRAGGPPESPGEGELVGRARALRILPAPAELPERALELVHEQQGPPLPGPHQGHEVRFALDSEEQSFAATAMEMRFLRGRPLKGGLPDVGVPSTQPPIGTATVWMRLRHPLLPGEPASPLASVPAAADFGNGVSAVLPFDEYLFINADLDISLDRRPAGDWIALEARTLLHPEGIGWAESVLHDERGRLGLARQVLVVQRR
jgi:acyl-Coa thioesterase superfamily protein/acyl-CoA thioesterase superfamily protein